MIINRQNLDIDFEQLPVSEYWSSSVKDELKMHKIHAYPAKFSSVMVNKSLEFAAEHQLQINTIADIFCGCGTTALEAKRHSLPFWGCDINPVATLIARVKSKQYNGKRLSTDFRRIVEIYTDSLKRKKFSKSNPVNPRLDYWFPKNQKKNLHYLLCSIKQALPQGPYRDFFLCAFSNILKGCSRWLTKSIKPQVDPEKVPNLVKEAFEQQVIFMMKANSESVTSFKSTSRSHIFTQNFLKVRIRQSFVDLLITSPPYVTSYEYADLHQLSSMWLGFAEDYRALRKGSIGSLYNSIVSDSKVASLNPVGYKIYSELLEKQKSQAKSAAQYLFDMQETSVKTFNMLNENGMSIFVIGNTSYQNVNVDNAKFLCCCLLDRGFTQVEAYKRKIGPKILSPYRDELGKFSNNPEDRKVYSHEFVIIGTK